MMELDMKQVRETRAFRCLECAKCSGICPVARYSETFSPRMLLIRGLRNSRPEALKSPDLWSCLNCMNCDAVCPSQIDYSRLIQLFREAVGIENLEGTCSHGGILQSISRMMTSPLLQQNRLEWLNGDLKTSRSSDYLYFVGCLPYFDALFSDIDVDALNIARSTLTILNYFDVHPQLLANEKCCGHDFYWNGDRATFRKLAEANMEMIRNTGASKIITSCPECYRTLKIEYAEIFGKLPYDVQHISEFLAAQLDARHLTLTGDNKRLTFQDPCRLGRHLGIYEAPRDCLRHLQDTTFTEMHHHHDRAVCCGVSGWMNCSFVSKQIQINRLHEAAATDADIFVTACAKCKIHFSCAMHDANINKQFSFHIKDITEVFAERLSNA